jgi:hypothetical protein
MIYFPNCSFIHFTIFDWFKSLKAPRISFSGSEGKGFSISITGLALEGLLVSDCFRRAPALALVSFCVYGYFYKFFDIFSIFSL